MSYTHSYELARSGDLRIREIGEDIASLIQVSAVPVANGIGEPGSLPEITDEIIMFNGEDPNDYETFFYPPDFDWNRRAGVTPGYKFTKTACRLYDEVVAAAHLVLKYHLGSDVRISLDGTPTDDQCRRAVDLFQRTFPDREVADLLPA